MAKRSKESQGKPAKKSAGKSGATARARSSPQRRTASGEESFAPSASPDAVLAAMAKGRSRAKATPETTESEAAAPPVQAGPPPEQAFADAMDRLNEMQQRFVQEYLLRPNASEAARKAGYAENSARQQGARLLSHDDVSAALAAGKRLLGAQYDVTLDNIVGELAIIALSDPAEIAMVSDEEGEPLKITGPQDIRKLPPHLRKMIAGWSWDKAGNFTLRFYDKRAALVDLGKHVGLGAGNGGEDIAAAMLAAMRMGMQRAKNARG